MSFADRPLVVLVHGLFMRPLALRWLARQLRNAGHDVACFGYRTVTTPLKTNALELVEFVGQVCSAPRPVVLVGHSMGGLVSWAAAQRLPEGKVVSLMLLGSPVQGSRAARQLRRLCGGRRTVAPTLHDWMERPARPSLSFPVFTLAGTRAAGLGRLLCRFQEPSDGTVSVAETRVDQACETCLLPVSHTGMLFSTAVAQQLCRWLATGLGRPTRVEGA